MEKRVSVLTISCFFLMALILALGVSSTSSYAGTYEYTIESGSYEIVDAGNGYQEINMEGFGQLFDPGKPRLPSKIFTIAIPPGASVVSVTVEETDVQQLPGGYNILPAPSPMPGNGDDELIKEAMDLYERNYQATYSSDAPYPEERGALISQGGYRKYNIVNVRFTPFDYRPQSGKLYLISRATVIIEYSLDAAAETRDGLLLENLPEVEERAKEILDNYEDTQSWYPLTGEEPGGGLYEFVIVTTDDLVDAVQPLVDWERSKGRTVYVATTTWIDANYSGADLQRRIRYFLRDKYPSAEWGILKVCLVGDLTDVPMRYCDVRKTGSTNTAILTPTDYYYAELTSTDSASWDDDWDGFFGERGDDAIDFITEVDVGRIPWSDPAIVESICTKMANYEYSTYTAYKRNVLLPKAFWDEDTDNAVLAQMMWNDFYNGAGYTRWRIYEYGPTFYSTYTRDATLTHTNVIDDWNGDEFGSVCWSGHGSSTSVSYNAHHGWMTLIHASDYPSLDDDYPSVIYSNSCSTAYPEVASLGRNMMRSRGVAFVGSTRVMWYMPGWDELSDGWGNTLAYLFSQKSRYAGGNSIGWSHTHALRGMYTTYGWDGSEDGWVSMFEYVLYGNPDLWIRARPGLPNLDYFYRTGWDYPIVPRSAAGATSTWCPVTSTLPGNTANTYFNWTVENNGMVDAPLCKTSYYVDGRFIGYRPAVIAAGSSDYIINWNYGPPIQGGRHSLYYDIDSDEEVWETSEGDNWWGRQFVWSPYGLSDDTPIYRSAPPTKDAWASPYWYNNDGFSFYVAQSHPNKWWSAVGILPYNSSADYDLRLWDIGDYTGSEQGFGGGYLEWSSWGGSASDFVIVNDNAAPAGTYYAGAINYNDETGNFHIEEAASTKIYPGTNGPYSMSSTGVLDIYETNRDAVWGLSAGDWGFKLEQTSGTCDLGMSLYDDETVHARKNEYMTGGYADSNGDGEDEFMQVTIPDDGWHGLVVWKVDSSDYSKTTTYNIKMGKCATPGIPANPSPADGATGVSINTDLDWDDCADTEYYEVWFRKGSDPWQTYTTEVSEWNLDPLEYNETYTWIIKAVNICGDYTWGPYWDFTTELGPKITVTTPNGGETWYIGEYRNIRWTSQNVTGNVKIEISRNSGLTWSTITGSTANDGVYGWTVTSPASTLCRVKVSSVSDPGVSDMSNANFTIAFPFITVSSPNGGETWYVGDTNDITWTSGGAEKYVKIEISRNSGSTWSTITSSTLNVGLYNWIVTGPASNQCMIRISDSSLSDTSDRLFAIIESAPLCEGDFDGDSDVDGSDLAVFAADFGRTDCTNPPPCEGDFDNDGDVDGSDLAVFAADFGRTDCP